MIERCIPCETVFRPARESAIVWLARGPYQFPDIELGASHSLVEAAELVPKGVVCLISALQLHRLTVHTPSAVWMALPHATRKLFAMGGARFHDAEPISHLGGRTGG